MNRTFTSAVISFASVIAFQAAAVAQDGPPPGADVPASRPQNPGGPGGMPGGPGGGFPGMDQERKVLKKHDVNGDGWLNADERAAARATMKEEDANRPQGQGRRVRPPGGGPPGAGGPGGGGPGGGGGGGGREPGTPGPKVSPNDVKNYPDAGMFDSNVLRTIFIDFDSAEWEEELEAFHNTDVEVPCTLTVDGKTLPHVGASFRGASSYMMIPRGSKRSFNLTIDGIDSDQRLYGEKTLNLLNANGDPSFLSTILYSRIAREHIPAPRANFVKVVVNGESWGVFINAEQFNRDFLEENFGTDKGARWKVSGSPNGRSGLDYVGEDLAIYKQRYQIKSKDDEDDWLALIELCRVLTETPIEDLEQAITPLLDIDSTLWFLALDNVLVNTDGYWVRASDYNIYRDPKGVFHLVPHDMNEAFAGTIMGPGMGGRGQRGAGAAGGRPGEAPPGGPPTGPGGGGGEGDRPPRDLREIAAGDRPPQQGPAQQGGAPARLTGIELNPLIGMDDATKPLRSRLLAVPSLRARYLANVKEIARESLDWDELGPFVAQCRDLIAADIEADTRKLTSYQSFMRATGEDIPAADAAGQPQQRPRLTLEQFCEMRSKFLLDFDPDKAGGSTKEPGR